MNDIPLGVGDPGMLLGILATVAGVVVVLGPVALLAWISRVLFPPR